MDYQFIETSIDDSKIHEYAKLLSVVFPNTDKFTTEFLKWQYKENPLGKVVGFDAYFKGELAAHYVCIPVLYQYNNQEIKGLLSLNTATLAKHQGKGLFTKLAQKTYDLGVKLGYQFVIGVANQNSIHGFLKKLGFYLVSPLQVKVGVGNIAYSTEGKFSSSWNKELIDWRLRAQNGKYTTYNKIIYTSTGNRLIKAIFGINKPNGILEKKNSSPFKMWIGINSELKTNGIFINLPDRFKPSPLNLIFKNLSEDKDLEKITKNDFSFELIDFDAY